MRLRRRHWNMRAMQQHFAAVMCLLLAITLCLVQIPVSYAADESEYAQEMADDPESPQNRMYTDKTTSGTAGSAEEPAAVVMQDNPYYLGIDVSYWNGESIDWDKVRASGVQFVFVRVGYAGWSSGTISTDYMYEENIQNAYEAGLKVGVYIYSQATSPAEARSEADFIISKIEPYRQFISMPVVMDMESPMTYGSSNAKTYWARGAVSKAQVAENYKAFSGTVHLAGYTPMFYTYTSWITEHIGNSMSVIINTGDPFWIAEYPASVGTQPPLFSKLYGAMYKYEFWQYSSTTAIAGIGSNVDCNRWYTDDLEKYSTPAGSWSHDGNGWCYLDANGNKYRSIWVKARKGWTWLDGNGYWVEGTQWLKANGSWYYLVDGYRQAGRWILDGGSWYYVSKYGVLTTGWQRINGAWYHMSGSGAMQTGWQKIGDSWYYMNSDGVMQTGWQKIQGSWYYMNGDGVMQTGWEKIGSRWYYLNSSGIMQTGWKKIGSNWYYFNESGTMGYSEWRNGYWLDANGVWSYQPKGSWRKSKGRWWFGDTSGWYARNTKIWINGSQYSFDADGWLK